jgi:hypothetical protein
MYQMRKRGAVLLFALSLLPQLSGQGTFAGVFDSLVLWHRLTDTSGSTTAVVSSRYRRQSICYIPTIQYGITFAFI